MNPRQGKLIVTEGMDGAGKSTQADLIEQWCMTTITGTFIHRRKEPGSSLNGDLRKMLFHSDYSKDLNQVTAGCLFFLDHYNNAEWCAEKVANGDIVISDRWCYSQYAYDSVKRESNVISLELYRKFEQLQIKPDLVLCFDIPPDVADARLKLRVKDTAQADKQWGERGDLSTKVAQAYQTLRHQYQQEPIGKGTAWCHISSDGVFDAPTLFEQQVEPILRGFFDV